MSDYFELAKEMLRQRGDELDLIFLKARLRIDQLDAMSPNVVSRRDLDMVLIKLEGEVRELLGQKRVD